MSTYFVPDLTGTNSDFLRANVPYMVYKLGQKLYFRDSPIFVTSLKIAHIDGTGRVLVRDTDYEVRDDDIDEDATQRAKLEDPTFTAVLVKSVTMLSQASVGKSYALTFQQFYLTNPVFFDDGRPLELTPELMKYVLGSLADLRQQQANVVSPIAPNPNPPKLLPFDIDGVRAGNIVTDEPVTVNTLTGGKVIRLAQGAFFSDSVVIKYNGVTLNPQTDYMPVQVSPLTIRSQNKSGIYQYILLNGSYADQVLVTYRAVGGDVQAGDIDSVYELMMAIKSYLNDGNFVTGATLQETPSFRSVVARLNLMEDGMRRIQTGTPTYGDATGGQSITRGIKANDADLHWYTIATLHTVEGSPDIVTADAFRFRVFFPGNKTSLTGVVDVNLQAATNKVSFHTESLVFDPKYKLFETTNVAAQGYPMVRVVWNEEAEAFSGACLQIGIPLPDLADLMVVEDMSTQESSWILTKRNPYVIGQPVVEPSSPEDNGFTLPDGSSVWSDVSAISFRETFVPRYEEGYLAYSGATVQVGDLTTVNPTGALFQIVLPKFFPVERIRALDVVMSKDNGTEPYILSVPLTGSVQNDRYGRIAFSDSGQEVMTLNAHVNKDALSVITINLNITENAPPLISSTPSIKTDVVRYILAKV